MSVTVKLLAHSINSKGHDITSWELEYNKSIHAELMTHRVFSRNAGSSRAIPFEKALSSVEKNPALPVLWGGHKPGMSPGEELTGDDLEGVLLRDYWARQNVMQYASAANSIGLHKSITNRWIDPWAHIKVIVTTTQLKNFFKLRCHPAAEPIFQCLAYKMLEVYIASTPRLLADGDWHIPYWEMMPEGLSLPDQLRIATARCCWVSYNSPDKTTFDIQAAFDRHNSCVALGHWSPLEHCAMAVSWPYTQSNFDDPSNFFKSNWLQYRKTFAEESTNESSKTPFDYEGLLSTRPTFTQTNFVR